MYALPSHIQLSCHIHTDEAMQQLDGTFLGCGISVGTLSQLIRTGIEHYTVRIKPLSRLLRKTELEVWLLCGEFHQPFGRQQYVELFGDFESAVRQAPLGLGAYITYMTTTTAFA